MGVGAISRRMNAPIASRQVTPEQASLWRGLAPLCAMVFAEFLAMGLPLAVLPERVHAGLGYGSFVVGLVVGAQSWATLLTRHAAGVRSDHRGPRPTALLGLALSTLAGGTYALSGAVGSGLGSLATLMLGRALLGFGESLVITSALAWGVALAGRERSGKVMTWIGIAMYGALAAGAPLGAAIASRAGFAGASLAAAVAPLFGVIAASVARSVAPTGGTRLPFHRVVSLIAVPGAGLTLCALGFGAIAGFATLRFAAGGWAHAPLAMSAFGVAYVLARVLFGGLPDRLGGSRVAAGSAAIAALGQLGLWLAPSGELAVAAAALTGFGFSLAFPAFGVEAIRAVPPASRGAALGAYAACFDLTMGVGVPALGLVVAGFGYPAAFAVGTLGALGSLGIALALARRGAAGEDVR